MFGSWKNCRLKAAEKALDAGRIDDAYEAIASGNIEPGRSKDQLLDAIATALLARVRVHANAGRYDDALSDIRRLEAIKRGDPDRSALKVQIEATLKHRNDQVRDNIAAVEDAKRKLQAGRLESGRLALERIDDADQKEQLMDELDIRAKRTDQLLAQATAAMEQGDALAAWRYVQDACQKHGKTQEADRLIEQLVPQLANEMAEAINDGRVGRFLKITQMLKGSDKVPNNYEEIPRTALLIENAINQLNAGDYLHLKQTLLRLQGAYSKADWIKETLATVTQVLDSQDRLLASPLGLLSSTAETPKPQVIDTISIESSRHATIEDSQNIATLEHTPLQLLVDGGCSALMLASTVVRIGRAGGRKPIDVPIPGDIESHHADIRYDGEDYFLVAYGPVSVNHKDVRRILLRDGDRIRLGEHVKMTFRRPSRKSETAVLTLDNRHRLAFDVSDVVLFRDTCLIGPQESCHLKAKEGETRIVVFERDGQLFARSNRPDGRPAGRAIAVNIGKTFELGDQSITVTTYHGCM